MELIGPTSFCWYKPSARIELFIWHDQPLNKLINLHKYHKKSVTQFRPSLRSWSTWGLHRTVQIVLQLPWSDRLLSLHSCRSAWATLKMQHCQANKRFWNIMVEVWLAISQSLLSYDSQVFLEGHFLTLYILLTSSKPARLNRLHVGYSSEFLIPRYLQTLHSCTLVNVTRGLCNLKPQEHGKVNNISFNVSEISHPPCIHSICSLYLRITTKAFIEVHHWILSSITWLIQFTYPKQTSKRSI